MSLDVQVDTASVRVGKVVISDANSLYRSIELSILGQSIAFKATSKQGKTYEFELTACHNQHEPETPNPVGVYRKLDLGVGAVTSPKKHGQYFEISPKEGAHPTSPLSGGSKARRYLVDTSLECSAESNATVSQKTYPYVNIDQSQNVLSEGVISIDTTPEGMVLINYSIDEDKQAPERFETCSIATGEEGDIHLVFYSPVQLSRRGFRMVMPSEYPENGRVTFGMRVLVQAQDRINDLVVTGTRNKLLKKVEDLPFTFGRVMHNNFNMFDYDSRRGMYKKSLSEQKDYLLDILKKRLKLSNVASQSKRISTSTGLTFISSDRSLLMEYEGRTHDLSKSKFFKTTFALLNDLQQFKNFEIQNIPIDVIDLGNGREIQIQGERSFFCFAGKTSEIPNGPLAKALIEELVDLTKKRAAFRNQEFEKQFPTEFETRVSP